MRLKLKTLRSLLEMTKILSYARSVLPSYRHQSCKSIDCYQYIVSALILTPLANYKPAIFYVTPGTEKLNKYLQAEEKANICGRNSFMFPAGTFFLIPPFSNFGNEICPPEEWGADTVLGDGNIGHGGISSFHTTSFFLLPPKNITKHLVF